MGRFASPGQDREILSSVVKNFPDGKILASRAQLLAEKPGLVGPLILRALNAPPPGPDHVVGLTDEEAVILLTQRPKKPLSKEAAEATMQAWRAYATALGYFGPVAWLVRTGFTLKQHAPAFGPCREDLQYLQD